MLTVTRMIFDSTLTLSIRGTLDYSTIDNFNENLGDLTHISCIRIDFTEMEFIDSTGIGAVLEIIYTGSENNICVEFNGLKQEAKELFETVGVFQILKTLQGR